MESILGRPHLVVLGMDLFEPTLFAYLCHGELEEYDCLEQEYVAWQQAHIRDVQVCGVRLRIMNSDSYPSEDEQYHADY